jgi:hypothetical protein
LMPLISLVIAFVPQSSCEELIALHSAGRLDLISVGDESQVEKAGEKITYHYTDKTNQEQSQPFETFVDCIGQRHLSLDDFPFKSLVADGTLSPAKLKFESSDYAEKLLRSGNKKVEKTGNGAYFLNVPGIAIDDYFRVIDGEGKPSLRIYLMTVSYLGGFNPDYSGLDFCEEASKIIAADIFQIRG